MFNFGNEELALNNIDFQNILDSENNTYQILRIKIV